MIDNETLKNLLRRCAENDRKALEALYRLTAAKLFGVALRIVKRRDWAEDILQECYVNIWQHAMDYRAPMSAPMTWMTSIVRHRCLDWLRRPQRETAELGDEFLTQWADEAVGPLGQLLMADDSRRLAGCMKNLESGARQAIALAFLEGLSHQEAATQLHQPLGTVKSWIRRGLDKLRRCLT